MCQTGLDPFPPPVNHKTQNTRLLNYKTIIRKQGRSFGAEEQAKKEQRTKGQASMQHALTKDQQLTRTAKSQYPEFTWNHIRNPNNSTAKTFLK